MPAMETPAVALEKPEPMAEEPRAAEKVKEPEGKKKIDPKHLLDGTEKDEPEEAEENRHEEKSDRELLQSEHDLVMDDIRKNYQLMGDALQKFIGGIYSEEQMITKMEIQAENIKPALDHLRLLANQLKLVEK